MKSRLRHQHKHMPFFLIVHLLLVAALPVTFTIFGGIWDYLIVLFIGTLVLVAIDYHYASYLFWTIAYLIYLVKELIASNLAMAWLVMQPKPKTDPGIIAVPLKASSDLEITVLATSIALTPGTLVIDMQRDEEGRATLFVHAINVGSPERLRTSIHNGFERMILNISRGRRDD